jgi:hypothetical protein
VLKRAAMVFGIAFIGAGILGFVPGVTTADGHLVGLFHVNALHNIVHLASGAVALWVAYQSENAARLYFQVFGVVYAVVALLGVFYGSSPIFGILANNVADVVLHAVIAIAALYFGFAGRQKPLTA